MLAGALVLAVASRLDVALLATVTATLAGLGVLALLSVGLLLALALVPAVTCNDSGTATSGQWSDSSASGTATVTAEGSVSGTLRFHDEAYFYRCSDGRRAPARRPVWRWMRDPVYLVVGTSPAAHHDISGIVLRCIRTTLTIDDDVAAQLEQLRARTDKSFKELVNEVLRTGLAHLGENDQRPAGPFTRVASLGKPRLPDIDDVSEALAVAEGDAYR